MQSGMFGVAACLATLLAGCSGSFMELRQDYYTIRKGVTPQEFFGARVKTVPPPDMKYQLDGDVWEVWDFTVNRLVPVSMQNNDDFSSTGNTPYYLSHQEFVAFKNGRMEDWGWGKLPHILKKNPTRLTKLDSWRPNQPRPNSR